MQIHFIFILRDPGCAVIVWMHSHLIICIILSLTLH